MKFNEARAAKAKKVFDKVCLTVGTCVTAISAFAVSASAKNLLDLGETAIDTGDITDTIAAIVPKVIPVIISVTGIRKGISFLVGSIRGC